MGNAIGVDISGTLVRVACISYPSTEKPLERPDTQKSEVIKPDVDQEIAHKDDQKIAQNQEVEGHDQEVDDDVKDCQRRHHERNNDANSAIKQFLDGVQLWGLPRTFCFPLSDTPVGIVDGPVGTSDGPVGTAVCFVIDISEMENALREALPYLLDSSRVIEVTGSGSASLKNLLGERFAAVELRFQVHREISCILEALDFLVCHVPEACFRYAKTHRALNSVLADDKNYTALPLEKEDRDSFYPFLLVNLKAGVSFHLVTGPNESERVGGATIGGATFMGLIRLLCRSISSPLDAFLLAQSGDNSTTDMLVGDIYGGDYPAIGLKGTTIASTLGKIQTTEALKPAHYRSLKWVQQTHRKRETKTFSDSDASAGTPCGTPPTDKSPMASGPLNQDCPKKENTKKANPNNDDLNVFTGRASDLSGAPCGHAKASVSSFNSRPSKQHSHKHSDSHLPTIQPTPALQTTSQSSPSPPVHITSNASSKELLTSLQHPETNKPQSSLSQQSQIQQSQIQQSRIQQSQTPPISSVPDSQTRQVHQQKSFDCGDPLCCCCGLQKWTHHETSEASAAAAAGILEEPQFMEIDPPLQPRRFFVEEGALKSGPLCVQDPTEADVARSILTMMSYNVAQQAYLNSVIHGCSRIVLVGYYLEMPGYLSSIQHCVDFWSNGGCKINFVRLAPNLGALGASLRTRQTDKENLLSNLNASYLQKACGHFSNQPRSISFSND